MDILLCIAAITLWQSVRSFSSKLRNSQQLTTFDPSTIDHCDMAFCKRHVVINIEARLITWPQIWEEYIIIKKLAALLNDSLGMRMMLSLLKNILYYAISFNRAKNLKTFVFIMVYLGGPCANLLIAADVDHTVSNLYTQE